MVVAVFGIVCPSRPDFIVVTSVRVVVEALFRFPIVQTPVEVAYVPEVEDAETKFRPECKISITVTSVALSGPLFVSVSVYVTVSPTFAVDLSDVFSIERLETGILATVTCAEEDATPPKPVQVIV